MCWQEDYFVTGVTRDEISESDQIRDVTYILGRAKKKITRGYMEICR